MIKDVKQIVKKLKKDGWEIVSMKRHIKMRHETYGTQTLPKTPKDFHWKGNVLKQIEDKYTEHGATMP